LKNEKNTPNKLLIEHMTDPTIRIIIISLLVLLKLYVGFLCF